MLYKKTLLVAVNSRYTHSNPAVFCIKNYLQKFGIKIELIEFNINGQVLDMLAEITAKEPDLVGFSCYIWNLNEVVSLTKMMKKVLPKCKILWGGPQMNDIAEKWLEKYPEVDYIIEGEGEKAWQVLLSLESEKDLPKVPNMWYRQNNGKIAANPKSGFIDLSEIPFYYSDIDLQNLQNRIIYYESSRGCPFGCKFCLSANEPVRYRDLAMVKKDLLKLANSGCKKIKFIDRTFNSNQKRAVEILRYLLSVYREGICFHLELEPLCLTKELVDILLTAPAGYFQAEIGVQSLYKPALSAVGRRELAADAVDLIRSLIKADNIHIHLDLIGGLPYETLTEFKNSFDKLYSVKPHYLQLGFLKVLPGTPLSELSEKYGLVFIDEPPYQVLQTPWLSYQDMLELGAAEYAVDNYYNEQFFMYTLDSALELWQKAERSPFDFFNGLDKADKSVSGGKSQIQKGKVLLDYLNGIFPEKAEYWQNALRFDFIRANLNPPAYLGVIDEMSVIKENEEKFLHELAFLSDMPRRKWLKRIRVFELNVAVSDCEPGLYAADTAETSGIFKRPKIIKIK